MTPQERNYWVAKMGARVAWWALGHEPIIEPTWEIIDAHVHLWDSRTMPDPQGGANDMRSSRYLVNEFLRDVQSGHRVGGCVYVESGSRFRPDGPVHLRPVGETQFACAIAKKLALIDNAPRIQAIVAFADLRHSQLESALDSHLEHGAGLLRGVRHSTARLDDPTARLIAGAAPSGLSADREFRRGVALLGERGLSFDAFQFHFQLEQLRDLARAAPRTTIIVNHLGAPLGFNRNARESDPVFIAWREAFDRLAELPNVVMKLGGMASIVTGYDGYRRDKPPSSEEFVAERGHYFHHAIRQFGTERCLFESNFPVDSVSIGYAGLWNAYKRIASDYGRVGRTALLSETARRVYRIRS